MKKPQALLFVALGWVLAAAGPALSASTDGPDRLMTQGKLAADLGDQRAAERAFATVAAGAATPETARAEALVRLGVVQRALGKTQASAATFRKAMQSSGRDAEVTRLLALALTGVAPDGARWATMWPKLRLASVPAAGGARPVVHWPDPGPVGVREAFPWTDPVTLDVEDVPLTALLHHLIVRWEEPDKRTWPGPRESVGFENWPESYQPPAGVDRLDLLIHAGVQGHGVKVDPQAGPRVTLKATAIPWNEVFENVLASNGLGFAIHQNLLFIARVEDLGAIERLRGRKYGGWPVDLHFLYANLLPGQVVTGDPRDKQSWKLVPDAGLLGHLGGDIWPDLQLRPDAGLQGTVTLRLRNRPTREVLALFLISNDLAATRVEDAGAKPGTTVLRICKAGDVKGVEVDLSRLPPSPPRPNP